MLDLDKFLQIVPIWAHISQHDLETAICICIGGAIWLPHPVYLDNVIMTLDNCDGRR